MGTEDEARRRRLDELNLAIETTTRELRKLAAERDALLDELAGSERSKVAPGDPMDSSSPQKPGEAFVVPWSPEEDLL